MGKRGRTYPLKATLEEVEVDYRVNRSNDVAPNVKGFSFIRTAKESKMYKCANSNCKAKLELHDENTGNVNNL